MLHNYATRTAKPVTPWGEADHVEHIADGITRYSTPGHGGYGLSAARLASMPPALRAVPTWAGRGWYEEDVDWALVALAFPDHFDDRALHHAILTVTAKDSSIGAASGWIENTPEGRTLKLRAARWVEEHADHYEPGAMSTSGKGWRISAHRIGGGRSLLIDFPEGVYPPSLFTEADARAMGGQVHAV